jgi:hypothetical protein
LIASGRACRARHPGKAKPRKKLSACILFAIPARATLGRDDDRSQIGEITVVSAAAVIPERRSLIRDRNKFNACDRAALGRDDDP